MELRRGTFEIVLDGRSVGSIEWHDTVELPIEPGRHVLRLLAGRLSSRDQQFEARDGDVVNFRCHGAMVWPRYLVSMVKADTAISLRHE